MPSERLPRQRPAAGPHRRGGCDPATTPSAEKCRDCGPVYRSLFDNMQEGFAYCRMLYENGEPCDFTYLEVNPAFERLTGLKDVAGRKVSEVIPGIRASDPGLFVMYGRVASGGAPEKTELYVQALDMWFSVSAYCPAPEHFVAVFDVITDRKHAEEALKAAKAAAERASSAKSRFLAAVSHDLRQPLSALSLYVGILKDKLASADAPLADSIADCVDNLSEMLSDLLDLSMLDAGVVKPNVSDFALGPILTKVVAAHAPAALHKGLDLRYGYFDLVGRTDPVLFQRILGNLVANAVRYTRRGAVLIGCRRRQGKRWIEIWDTGIGIPADKTTEIFEEFRQIGNDERNQTKGTGLGLAIVAKAAALLGLEVRLKSRPGRGSMFAVELPLGEFVEPVEQRRYEHRPLRIALVEDNARVADAVAYALAQVGHEVVAGASRAELELRLRGIPPDIVISDYRLGEGEDGFAVIGAFRTAFGVELPALIITGDTDPAVIRRMSESRISVLHKPLDIEALCRRIAALTA